MLQILSHRRSCGAVKNEKVKRPGLRCKEGLNNGRRMAGEGKIGLPGPNHRHSFVEFKSRRAGEASNVYKSEHIRRQAQGIGHKAGDRWEKIGQKL